MCLCVSLYLSVSGHLFVSMSLSLVLCPLCFLPSLLSLFFLSLSLDVSMSLDISVSLWALGSPPAFESLLLPAPSLSPLSLSVSLCVSVSLSVSGLLLVSVSLSTPHPSPLSLRLFQPISAYL